MFDPSGVKILNVKMTKRGFTLLEVTVAIFVVTVGLVGIFTAIQNLSISASSSSNRLIAIYLAQEGIEIVKNIRDTNWLEQRFVTPASWNEGLTDCSGGCEIDYNNFNNPTAEDPVFQLYRGRFLKINPTNGFYNYTSGIDTPFKRKITITATDPDTLTVRVEVFWQERGRNYQVSVVEKMYNWH